MTGTGEEPVARGEAIVELLVLLEHTMDDVDRTLPAVDHLSRPPVCPTSDDRARVAALLGGASPGVRDAFERWCVAEDAFRAAVADLEELRVHEAGDPAFQPELTRRIHTVRDARAELHRLAAELRTAVALEIGDDARRHSGEATISP